MNNSAIRVLDILELFADSHEPLTVSDITKKLGYPKTSVFDIVTILADRGFIMRTSDRAKTYVIGPMAYFVGMSYLANTDLRKIAEPILSAVRDELGETCYLAVEDNGWVIYLDKLESSQPIRSICPIGAKRAMYITGLGKAMLAAMPEERVKEIAARGLEPHTPTTITTVDALLDELARIRAQGFAHDMGEDNQHVRCTAAVIRDASGKVAGAISVAMLDVNFTDETRERSEKLIPESALKISRLLGFCGNKLYE